MSEPVQPVEHVPSTNWGAPIIYCGLLFAAVTHRHTFWGYLWEALYLALIGVAVHTLVSPKEWAAEQKRRPSQARKDFLVSTGVPYLLFPVIAWVMVFPLGLNAGAIVPAFPWVFLILFAIVVIPLGAIANAMRGRKADG